MQMKKKQRLNGTVANGKNVAPVYTSVPPPGKQRTADAHRFYAHALPTAAAYIAGILNIAWASPSLQSCAALCISLGQVLLLRAAGSVHTHVSQLCRVAHPFISALRSVCIYVYAWLRCRPELHADAAGSMTSASAMAAARAPTPAPSATVSVSPPPSSAASTATAAAAAKGPSGYPEAMRDYVHRAYKSCMNDEPKKARVTAELRDIIADCDRCVRSPKRSAPLR